MTSRAPVVRKRLERLAMFTFAATLAVTGCAAVGGDDDGDKQEQDLGSVHPMYGMPPVAIDAGHADASHPATDAGVPCTPLTDDDPDPGTFAAMYGMPPVHPPIHPCPVETIDAGPAHEDAGGFHPMYGMPPAHQ